ncbi:MAG: WD40/YVTN/BNR-like repeat-containing protein, partial [Flavobacteriales bacterium]
NTNIMYLATGDWDAGDTYALGVLKSTDGGNTWNTTGLNWGVTLVRTTSRILINPNNTQIVICATSNGIYRTTDGGVNWTQTATGNFKDLTMKPGDSTTWYASSNQLFRSTDGGVTWTQLTSGLPISSSTQRMSVATTAADPNVVYVLASGNDSGLLGVWKSTNGGTSFTQMTGTSPNYLNWDTSATSTTGGQGWYDLRIAADPTNANTIVIGGVNVWKSTNGGTNFSLIGHWYGGGGAPYVHADIHAIHFVPNSSRLLIGNDGGVFMTSNGGTSFSDVSSNLPIAQIYRLSVSGTNNNVVISGWQDNGTNLKNGTVHSRPIGGDGMDCQINPSNGAIMYGELYYGKIYKSTNTGVSFSQIVGSGGTGVNEDGAWVTPYVLGPNPNHIYVGKSVVYKSLDGGTTFTASAAFGGTTDCRYIAVAPSNTNVVYASKGSSLFKSTDNAATFTQLTGLPGSTITSFCIHNTDPNKVWVTFSNYTAGTKIYYTSNGGTSWTNISGSLPNLPANVVVHQPNTSNGIYVGMDAGVYYRDDVLGNFVPYMSALPNAEVYDLDIQFGTNTITACTYGRGIWRAPLYTLPALDGVLSSIVSPIGTSCTASVTPEIQILNAGTTTLTSMVISYQISGQTAQTYTWNGSLS